MRIVTGKARLSYPALFKARAFAGQEPKYSAVLLIPKSDTKTCNAIMQAIEQTKQDAKDKWKGRIPANLKSPLRDGDTERPDSPEYKGMYFINASSKNPVKVYDRDGSDIIDPNDVYAGCYVRADINFYGFSVSGNNGIAAGLNSVMKWADGERLGGVAVSSSAYDDGYEDDDDLM